MKLPPIQMAVLASCGSEEDIFAYANSLTIRSEAQCHSIFVPSFAVPGDETRAVTETRQLAKSTKLDLIISEWLDDTRAMQDLIHLAQERGLPAVFLRVVDASKIGRIVVATGRGPNLYEQMWLARETAAGLGVPVNILHWTATRDCDPCNDPEDDDPLEKMCVRMLGMQVKTIQCNGPDFAASIAGSLRPDDLLVIGAPSPLRLVADFADSLPDQLAKAVPNPMLLLSSPPLAHTSLRRLLWGRLIKPRLHSRAKTVALKCLVDNLIRHNQLPSDSKVDMLGRALKREQISSTAMDCETAIPHVELPGFSGVAATLGIFPDGIDFGSEDGTPTRFVFLLVTPEGFSNEYLSVLSKISKRMLNPAVRKALLACKTAAEAIEILEPRKDLPPKQSWPKAYFTPKPKPAAV
ncbi:PTS sugar transporter subunit IIA [Pontiella agarivorans]|uniref:PTS sugar transporter subunit IIA n=1 Tax=Pontiella agarivorans TaxID=3038953 RepID=A0ABU5MVI8_9BACT|nr:PTS sugar transporter subunit IIA [Pontiella agarivorans]MDZ8118235.1 PTS sugar transporter subunit IIA [Pontiella agarivorans]